MAGSLLASNHGGEGWLLDNCAFFRLQKYRNWILGHRDQISCKLFANIASFEVTLATLDRLKQRYYQHSGWKIVTILIGLY